MTELTPEVLAELRAKVLAAVKAMPAGTGDNDIGQVWDIAAEDFRIQSLSEFLDNTWISGPTAERLLERAAAAAVDAVALDIAEREAAARKRVEELEEFWAATYPLVCVHSGTDDPAQFWPNGEDDCGNERDSTAWLRFVAAYAALSPTEQEKG